MCRVLNGELYVQRLQKLIYLDLCTDFFFLMKISLHKTGPRREMKSTRSRRVKRILHKQSVDKSRHINFCNLCVIIKIVQA